MNKKISHTESFWTWKRTWFGGDSEIGIGNSGSRIDSGP